MIPAPRNLSSPKTTGPESGPLKAQNPAQTAEAPKSRQTTTPQQTVNQQGLCHPLSSKDVSSHENPLVQAGLEHTTETPEKQHNPKITGPISGPVVTDTDLQTVIDRWPELPPPIRRQIVKLATPGSLALAGVNHTIERRTT